MAAGIVYHNITTASGVTFALAQWVPDTGSPDALAVPVSALLSPTTIASTRVAPTNTAGTLLAARATSPFRRAVIKNVGSVNVFLGKATVTAANGLLLAPGESISYTSTELLQAITASGTGDVAVLEEYYA